MNCDQAFEAMTRPAGTNSLRSESVELEQHLRFCPRCRQMQDVLAPALESLQQTDTETESSSYVINPEDFAFSGDFDPTSLSTKAEEVIRIADDAAQQLRPSSVSPGVHILPRQRSRAFPAVTLLLLVACFLVGGRFTLALMSNSAPENQANLVPVLAKEKCLWLAQDKSEIEQLASLESNSLSAEQLIQSCLKCHETMPREVESRTLPGEIGPGEAGKLRAPDRSLEFKDSTMLEGFPYLNQDALPNIFLPQTISPEFGGLAVRHEGEQGRSPRGLSDASNLLTL
ncbi:hypothetical protein Pla110_12960 [Polystyrenella longa]|uniref:Zinc-finger domain-containing protein n=1 Tax=Polystyrenella longa TaxID=2528007 RepID=A0A518CK30_9PLAN|nr:hypothetical protein Pla110_12960 [Polystyrenella longa]